MPKAKGKARVNSKHNRRVKNLVMVTSLSAVVLIASTYAWFVGLQAVNVSPFEIEIAAADSLELSINGEQWTETLTLTRENVVDTTSGPSTDKVNQVAYKNNTNNWPASDLVDTQKGLVPVSTVGLMSKDSSRMVLYEKASFTTSPGGYRLLASKINNDEAAANQKQKGYVAFDLFVKNYSGTEYITDLDNPDNDLFEEAIYLTTDSGVTISSNGGVGESGVQNSVRVAFAQVGRISGYSTNAEAITGISCTNSGSEVDAVTGLCRRAQIWEPNDTDHATAAINYYNASCLQRTGATLANDSYKIPADGVVTAEHKCKEITDGQALPTYSISRSIEVGEAVDIYDGFRYNAYVGNGINEIGSLETGLVPDNSEKGSLANGDEAAKPLVAVDTFTDTEKMYAGNKRPTFMTLAPNSITKIRVYVYIEGQDIDNYDYAQVGKQISVKFGFSKQRFKANDVGVTNDESNNNDLYNNLPTSVK